MTEDLLRKLEARGKDEGTLPELTEFYRSLLQLQLKVEERLKSTEVSLSSEVSSRRLKQGLAVLRFKELSLDWAYLKEIFDKVLTLFVEYPRLFNIKPEAGDKTQYRLPWLKKAVQAWFEGNELPPVATDALDRHHLADVLQAALKPFLVTYRKALFPVVNQENWRRGYCLICGGAPDFAVLDKERGARWLICSRCDAEWLFQRMECPYCNSKDQNDLAYFTDDEGRYRLYVCDNCKQYIKTIDLRLTEMEVLLPLERFFSLNTDIQAQEQGYKPGRKVTATDPQGK